MRKAVFVFVSLLLVAGAVVIPSDPVTAGSSSPPQADRASPAITEEELALLNEILDELKYAKDLVGGGGFQLFGSSQDSDVPDRLDEIEDMVNELRKLMDAGEAERALKYKYVIAGKLEDLINYIPLAPTNVTTAAAATGAANPLYDELVRLRAKIEKLIAIEERTVEIMPVPPPPPEIQRPPEAEKLIVYSAKFLCGPSFGRQGVQRGSYSTAINVHNPNDAAIYLYKKAVIALREDEPRGTISRFRRVKLEPDEAIDIDCVDIWQLLYPTRDEEALRSAASLSTDDISQLSALTPVSSMIRFITGFVVIYSTAPLDVVAVYSASTTVGFSLDVEYLSPSTRGTLPYTPPPQEAPCPQGCVCLTRTEATEHGLELCAEVATECGIDKETGELMYCWERGSQDAGCPQGCFCTSPEKAAEYGYVLCGEDKIKCGTDADGRDLLCYQRAPQEECPDACFCTTPAKAKELGYVLCGGQQIKCGTTSDGQDLLCYERAPEEQCPDGCFCTTPEKATEAGLFLCGGKKIECGKDAAGQVQYCYQRVPHQQCPDACVCTTPDMAEELGYVLCGRTKTLCGIDASGQEWYCYERGPQEEECPDACFCTTPEKAKIEGYILCGFERMECGKDATTGQTLYCYQKPSQGQCPRGCVCMTAADAKTLGYGYCGGQPIRCGVTPAGVVLYCYEKRQ